METLFLTSRPYSFSKRRLKPVIPARFGGNPPLSRLMDARKQHSSMTLDPIFRDYITMSGGEISDDLLGLTELQAGIF